MQTILSDLRYSFRRLRQSPGFAFIALLSLALGIGANTAIFSLVNTVLLRPLPVTQPEHLVTVYTTLNNGTTDSIFSYPNYKDVRDRNDVFTGLLTYRFAPMSLSHQGNNERIWSYLVSGNYFDVLGVKAMLGRTFLPEEDQTKNSHPVAVMSYGTWQIWTGQEAIGKRFNFGGPNDPYWEVIGVAGDGKYDSLGEEPRIAFYRPMLRGYSSWTSLVARTDGDPQAVLGTIRNEIHQLDATLPITGVKTLQEHMNVPLFPAQVAATVLGSFGLLALVLAALGIYGVMAYAVSQGTREIGIRMALGVSTMIVGHGLKLVVIGLVIGLAASFGLTHFLTVVLYGVSVTDLTTFLAIPLLLTLVALLACYIPARRAARVDPMVALRHD